MARPKGLIGFSGTMDGISVYKSKHGWIMRRAGGPSSEQVKNGAQFERARENGKEFGACGSAAGLLRKALGARLKESGDFRMVSRLTKLFMKIKNLDAVSVRGERSVAEGLQTKEGQKLMSGFEFNSEAAVSQLLKAEYTVHPDNGAISFQELVPKKHLKAPKNATHVRLRSIVVRADLRAKLFESQQSEPQRLALNSARQQVHLVPGTLIQKKGHTFHVLQICFYQELNGTDYPLKNTGFNAMQVVLFQAAV